MFTKLIFDIDNTIFNYKECEKKALNNVFNKIEELFLISKKNSEDEYYKQKNIYKSFAGKTASSHSKFIQIKYLLQKLNINLNNLDLLYTIYNETFQKNLTTFPYLNEFLDFCINNNIKLYCLSNNLCKDQIDRLKYLKILHKFEKIFTSEEFGIEKPDSKIYSIVLHLINGTKQNTAIIGDSFINDIQSPNYLELYCFWFNIQNKNEKISQNYYEFSNYKTILDFFRNYFQISKQFISISKLIGERFDLVQAGGGNISFKLNDFMFIKSSGCQLTELSMNKNYVGINYKKFIVELKKSQIHQFNKRQRETICNQLINNEKYFLNVFKPSIESSMH